LTPGGVLQNVFEPNVVCGFISWEFELVWRALL